MSEPGDSALYARNERVLWRVLPGMVLTQSVVGDPGAGAAELLGRAAQVWVVLDEPMSGAEIVAALEPSGDSTTVQTVHDAISQLVHSGHLQPTSTDEADI